MDRTKTLRSRKSEPLRPVFAPYLFVLLDVAHLDAIPSTRHCLIDLDRVAIGRGEYECHRIHGMRHLRIRVPDPAVSSEHTALERRGTGWMVKDMGSKNGTLLNGSPRRQATLSDGDIIELGHTFLLFRDSLAGAPHRADISETELSMPFGCRTLTPELDASLRELSRMAARSTASILIRGESGTGKELLARAVHVWSKRPGAWVPVNCSAVPEALFESELFGYKKGAYSGAITDHDGLIASSDKGTLFLDEIGELTPAAQAKLLRATQEHAIRPVGANSVSHVDLRVVAATNRDLNDMVARGAFRADLLARLSGFTVTLPPLSERRQDFGVILKSLWSRIPAIRGCSGRFSVDAARALLRYSWPRNIRQLRSVIVRAASLSDNGEIDSTHLPRDLVAWVTPNAEEFSATDTQQRDELIALLIDHRGNVASVARAIGKKRPQIYRLLRRYNIDPRQYRA